MQPEGAEVNIKHRDITDVMNYVVVNQPGPMPVRLIFHYGLSALWEKEAQAALGFGGGQLLCTEASNRERLVNNRPQLCRVHNAHEFSDFETIIRITHRYQG